MKTKAEFLAAIAAVAPQIAVHTLWEHDDDYRWEKDLTEQGLDEDDFQAWQSEVQARCIVNGQEIEGSAYMGGSLYEYGEPPDPDISGYFTHMVGDALEELQKRLDGTALTLADQCGAARMEVERELKARRDEQTEEDKHAHS